MDKITEITNPRFTTINIGMPNKGKDSKAPIEIEHSDYKAMKAHWELPLALRGGTLEMRKGGRKWLPQEPRETTAAYNNRLSRTTCYGAFNRTVNTLAGLPFMRPVIVENLPEKLSYLELDCDSSGNDMTNFANALLKEQIELGLSYILIDLPEHNGAATLEEERLFKLRPYLCQISPTSIFSWSVKKIGGLKVLTSIRIKEYVEDYDGISETQVEQIRLITPSIIQIWREDEKKEQWTIYKEYKNTLGTVPLIPVYGNRTGFMKALPPLEDLAWLNLKHYQQMSDLDNITHVANVPILFGAGFGEGELDGSEIGANRAIVASNENAKLSYVEHSGNAIGASQKSVEMLEERMAAMGSDLITRKSVDRQTATARLLDSSESVSMLQLMINNLESALEAAVKMAGQWIKVKADDIQIEIGDNLRVGKEGPNWLDILTNTLIAEKGMTLEQAAYELRRRGVLADNFKVNEQQGSQEPVTEPVQSEVEEQAK